MKKAIKRLLKKIFILILVVFAIYLVFTNISFFRDLAGKDSISMIIDTDSGRDLNDILAIVRVMNDPDVKIEGLLSAQWRLSDPENDSTVMLNDNLNHLILQHFNLPSIPNLRGENLPLQYKDPGKKIPISPASSYILKRASEAPYGEKLNIICLGPVTNLASALEKDPSMAQKIKCYMIGPSYDAARRIWNKNEVNTRLDLDAMDILFNNEDLEMYVMPSNVAESFTLNKLQNRDLFQQKDSLFRLIHSRITEDPGDVDHISASSLALIQAIINPEMSSQNQVVTPPENTQRKIHVFTNIDPIRMEKDWLNIME
ncbi:nucleoside hydrolase [Bacteroidota bacterium]